MICRSRQTSRLAVLAIAFAMAMMASDPCVSHGETILLDPTPYLSQADSPFDLSGLGTTFFLEDFEDGLLNIPGVASDPHATVYGPSSFPFIAAESVDVDDGVIDGNGAVGRSMIGSPLLVSGNVFVSEIRFNFNEQVLGHLPTHVGLVLTEGFDQIRFEAYGKNSERLGTFVLNGFGDGVADGGTAEDRFFGVIDRGGVSEIRLFVASVGSRIDSIPQIDHLQFGVIGPVIPEPGTLCLILSAAVAVISHGLLRRCRGSC